MRTSLSLCALSFHSNWTNLERSSLECSNIPCRKPTSSHGTLCR